MFAVAQGSMALAPARNFASLHYSHEKRNEEKGTEKINETTIGIYLLYIYLVVVDGSTIPTASTLFIYSAEKSTGFSSTVD